MNCWTFEVLALKIRAHFNRTTLAIIDDVLDSFLSRMTKATHFTIFKLKSTLKMKTNTKEKLARHFYNNFYLYLHHFAYTFLYFYCRIFFFYIKWQCIIYKFIYYFFCFLFVLTTNTFIICCFVSIFHIYIYIFIFI